MLRASSWNTTRFVVKHAVAAAVVTAGTGLFAGASWLVTFLWATMTSSGSDPALPFFSTVMGGVTSGAAASVLVLLPSTALAEFVTARARLRIWWQVPLAAVVILGIGVVATVVDTANQLALSTAATQMLAATMRRLAALVVYWWSLQSTDWLLRTIVSGAGKLWPSRFGALVRAQEESSGLLAPASRARFRVKDHFMLNVGAGPMLVVSGDILDGVVRGGMRACAIVERREVSARIHSVEFVDHSISNQVSNVGLLLPVNELDLRLWKAAAHEGAELKID